MGVRGPPWQRNRLEWERPSASYVINMLPPPARPAQAALTIPVRHLHQSIGKSKKPITVVRWTPEGRRLLTGGHTGEFMLWNGMAFNFETVMDAHYDQYQAGVTAAAWSHNHDWLISGGQKGDVKYWRPNFNNVETVDNAHHDALRDLAWCPSDAKFLSGSDDTTLKVFDFTQRQAELVLTGHGWDIKSCDWHPVKGLLVSGSKDHQVKFWDPRTGRCLTTLHSHKNTVTCTRFSRVNDTLLATSSRDQTARIFDMRMMRDICILRGHDKPISTLTWHPVHAQLLSTGSEDGSLYHYLLDEQNLPPGHTPTLAPYDTTDPANTPAQVIYPAHRVQYAHAATIWSLDWHPLGHILASGSKDNFTRFWSRARPGETHWATDRFHIGEEAAEAQGTWSRNFSRRQQREDEEQEEEDEADSLVDQRKPEALMPGVQSPPTGDSGPGIPGLIPGISAAAPPQPPPQVQPQTPTQVPAMPGSTTPAAPVQAPVPALPIGLAGIPNMDPSRLAAILASYGNQPGGLAGLVASLHNQSPQTPQATGLSQVPGLPGTVPGLPGIGMPATPPVPPSDSAQGFRRQGSLPSQEKSMREEQRRGNY